MSSLTLFAALCTRPSQELVRAAVQIYKEPTNSGPMLASHVMLDINYLFTHMYFSLFDMLSFSKAETKLLASELDVIR